MKVSIITATLNCEDVLFGALTSVAEQSHPIDEHIVMDGESTDNTVGILEQCRSNTLTVVSEPDGGIYDALNKGICRSSGDVIGFLHADDLFADENVIRDVVSAFEADPTLDAVYGDLVYVNREDPRKVIRHWRSRPFDARILKCGWMPPHPTLFIRRDWYRCLGGFDTSYRIAADYRFILKLFAHPKIHSRYIPRTLLKMRVGGVSNRSLSSLYRKSKEDWRALREVGFSVPEALFGLTCKNLSKICQFL